MPPNWALTSLASVAASLLKAASRALFKFIFLPNNTCSSASAAILDSKSNNFSPICVTADNSRPNFRVSSAALANSSAVLPNPIALSFAASATSSKTALLNIPLESAMAFTPSNLADASSKDCPVDKACKLVNVAMFSADNPVAVAKSAKLLANSRDDEDAVPVCLAISCTAPAATSALPPNIFACNEATVVSACNSAAAPAVRPNSFLNSLAPRIKSFIEFTNTPATANSAVCGVAKTLPIFSSVS